MSSGESASVSWLLTNPSLRDRIGRECLGQFVVEEQGALSVLRYWATVSRRPAVLGGRSRAGDIESPLDPVQERGPLVGGRLGLVFGRHGRSPTWRRILPYN